MTLRVISVPNPASGSDWTYVVPGQWLLNVIAVTAQINTLTNPLFALDYGGGAHDAQYTTVTNALTFGTTGPFAGAPNRAARRNVGNYGTNDFTARIRATTAFDTAQWCAEGWFNTAINGHTSMPQLGIWDNGNVSHLDRWAITAVLNGVNHTEHTFINGLSSSLANVSSGVWHHRVTGYDGANLRHYVDGALITTIAGAGAPDLTVTNGQLLIGGEGDTLDVLTSAFWGQMAGLAIYPSMLSGAQVANHFGASASETVYRAAVLADSPLAYWPMDEVAIGGARQTSLQITDGTNVVGLYPGQQNTATANNYTWTWAVAGQGTTFGDAGTINYVTIPKLIIPAGYTIGTVTPSIGIPAQWSNIQIWWDDTLMNNQLGLDAFRYPPGAHLVYQQQPS